MTNVYAFTAPSASEILRQLTAFSESFNGQGMTNPSDRESVIKRVNDAVTLLAEHVDTVQIFVTLHAEDGSTSSSYEYGRGNFYTRQGQVDEWLVMQREFQRCEARRRDVQDNGPDSD